MNQQKSVQFLSRKLSALLAMMFLATGVMACGELDSTENQEKNQNQDEQKSIEVAGTWETDWGGEEVIDDQSWSYMILVDYNNKDRVAITQNPSDDEYNPDLYVRIVWTPLEDDEFYYCMVDFGLETEEEAWGSAKTADENDLDGEGCGGNPWTKMTRK